jgi:hypothetical protein
MKLRTTRRIPTRFRTRLDTEDRSSHVVVVDVTELGAKADGLADVAPGTECRLHVMNEAVPGIVRWAAAGSVGIAFAQPLTPRQIDVVRHRRTPREEGERPRRGRTTHGFTEMR